MSNYIDPTSLTLPRFGELYGDRSIFLSGKAAWSGTILTTQDVKVTLPPLGDGALAVCLLPNAGYSLPSDGYTLYVKLNRASGNHSLVFNTDFFIYNATSIPHPSKDLIAVFTRQDGFIYTHSGEQVFTYTGTPIILGTLGASTISDYNFIVGPSFDNPKVTHTSIAQAISDAADGFSILILQGTYTVAAASNGAVDGAAGFAWTGKNISLTGASFDTVIQNTGSLTRAFGIQNASGSTINSILLVDFPQAVRFDNSSKCVVDVWQTNATFTDPASINTAENNQVTLNVSSAALTPVNQIRRYIVGTDSYYVDQSGSVLFTGSNFRVNGSAIFGGTVQVNGLATLNAGLTVTGLTTLNTGLTVTGLATFNNAVQVNSLLAGFAVVTDISNQLASLGYTAFNTPSTLVARDSSGNFSAGLINANNLNLNSLSSLAGAANQGVLVVDSSSVKRQSYADLSTHLNVINPINVAPPITGGATAQGMWLEWNKSGGDGESWIINQKGGGSGSIRFGRSDTSDNVTELGRFDSDDYFYAYSAGVYGIGDAGASNYSFTLPSNPYKAFLKDGMLCGNHPGFIAEQDPSVTSEIGTQTSNSGSGGTIRTRDGGYSIQFAVRNTIGYGGPLLYYDGEKLSGGQWSLSIYVTELATGRTGRFISFVESTADSQMEIGFGDSAGPDTQTPGFGTTGSQSTRPGLHRGVQINLGGSYLTL